MVTVIPSASPAAELQQQQLLPGPRDRWVTLEVPQGVHCAALLNMLCAHALLGHVRIHYAQREQVLTRQHYIESIAYIINSYEQSLY
jgi:hypothetical protein